MGRKRQSTKLRSGRISRLLRVLGILAGVGLLVFFASCGQAPEPEEGCDLPVQEHEHDTHVGGDFRAKYSSMACGPGTAQYPPSRTFTSSPEGYTSYVGQASCNNAAKPGVVAFRDLILKTYPCTGDYGISRACSQGGKSEHKEGRAWDWKLNAPHPAADAVLNWLLATDKNGVKHAMARRLGIMYMIWNRKVWKAYQSSKGWQNYTGASPHTDHVHFSFSWDGANKKTSFWAGSESTCTPQAETCNNKDDDCDGQVDEGLTQNCTTSCGAGTKTCQNGTWSACQMNTAPPAETCNGKDDDCDGNIDNGNPGGGKPCNTNLAAPCHTGVSTCQGGAIKCVPNVTPSNEVCNNKDDDCDGQIDNGNPGGGHACDPGIPGKTGVAMCVNGQLTCQAQGGPGPEPTTPDAGGTGSEPTTPDTNTTTPDTNTSPDTHTTTPDTGSTSGKKQLGESGCTGPNDCVTGLCAQVNGVARCTQSCSVNTQCPSGFECWNRQACWPTTTKTTPNCNPSLGPVDSSCTGNTDPETPFRVGGNGCRCAVGQDTTPPWGAGLLTLFVLFFFSSSRRPSHKE